MSRARDTADQINRVNSSAADATAITVDSSENVGIGTTPSEKLDVSGNIRALGPNSRVLFGPDGFEAGIKYATDASLQIASRTNENITFTNGNDGAERIRIDSDGLKFNGDTAAANALSDYETGTFTAGVSTGTIGGGDGTYVKVGDLVFCGITIGNFSNTSSGNAIVFTGLPFVSHSANQGSNGSVFCRYISGGFPDATQVNTSATTGRMWKSGSTGWASVNHNDITSGTNAYFFISLTYRAA